MRALCVLLMMGMGLCLFFAGCSSHLTEEPGNFQTRASRECPPHSVALLPFENLTECPEIAHLVRESLYSHLSPKMFEDVELSEVDSRLEAVDAASYEAIKDMDVREMGRLLQADAVVFGSVTKCSKVFIGIFSQVCVATSVEVYDTRTGDKVWADFEEACFHDGGVPLDILSIPLTTMRSGMNMREVVRVRVVDDMCRTLVARIPNPEAHQEEALSASNAALPAVEKTALATHDPTPADYSPSSVVEETISAAQESAPAAHPSPPERGEAIAAVHEPGPANYMGIADSFELQIGAFQEEGGAVETLVSVHDKGFTAFMRRDEEEGRVWYRVLVGPFAHRIEAETALERVRADLTPDAFIRRFHRP